MASKRIHQPMSGAYQALFDLGAIGHLSDGQLLERCATDRTEGGELAFAALVERHEALVWRICRAILRDPHEAEEAFQATLIVLARRARSLWVRDSLGPWLYEVAARTSRRHQATTRRRRAREAQVAATSGARAERSGPPALDADLAAALHEELAQLPAPLRAPLVLCDLEGTTHAEAARALGLPIGTVKSRQARGRLALRDRLARRGFDSLGVGPLLDLGSFGHFPPRAARSLARRFALASGATTTPTATATATARHLAQEVLRAMIWIQIRPFVAALAVGLGLATTGLGLVAPLAQEPGPPPVGGQPAPLREAPPKRGALRIAQLPHTIADDWATLARSDLMGALELILDLRKTEFTLRHLPASHPDLTHCPVALWPIAAGTPVTTRELLALSQWLEGGGTLIADAISSRPENDAAFRRLADGLLGRNLEPIPPGDLMGPPPHFFDKQVVVNGKTGQPQLEGIKVDGRWAVIYSRFDLSQSLNHQPPACPGYDRKSAEWIVANAIAYAVNFGLPRPPAPPQDKPADPAPNPVAPAPQLVGKADDQLKLRAQEIATRRARIAFEQARLSRELAELALAEHREVIVPRELAFQDQQIAHEQAACKLAQLQAQFSKDHPEPNQDANLLRAKQQAAEASYLVAQADRRTLEDRQALHEVRTLRPQLEKARAEEAAAEERWKILQDMDDRRARVGVSFPTGKTMEFFSGAFW